MPQLVELNLDIDLEFEELGPWQGFMRELGTASRLEYLRLSTFQWPADEEQREPFAAALADALALIPNLIVLCLRGCPGGDGLWPVF